MTTNPNEFELSYTADEINERLGKAGNAILFSEQDISDEEKAQARTNIGAIDEEHVQDLIKTAIDNLPTYDGSFTVEVE